MSPTQTLIVAFSLLAIVAVRAQADAPDVTAGCADPNHPGCLDTPSGSGPSGSSGGDDYQETPQERAQEQAHDINEKGIVAFKQGDYLTAISLYEQAYQLNPDPVIQKNIGAAQLNIAVEAYHNHDWQRAVSWYRASFANFQPTQENLAALKYAEDQIEETQREAAKLDLEERATAEFNTALNVLKAGNLQAGEAAFRAFLIKNPDNSGAYFNLSVALQMQGRWQEALAAIKTANAKLPSGSSEAEKYKEQLQFIVSKAAVENVVQDSSDRASAVGSQSQAILQFDKPKVVGSGDGKTLNPDAGPQQHGDVKKNTKTGALQQLRSVDESGNDALKPNSPEVAKVKTDCGFADGLCASPSSISPPKVGEQRYYQVPTEFADRPEIRQMEQQHKALETKLAELENKSTGIKKQRIAERDPQARAKLDVALSNVENEKSKIPSQIRVVEIKEQDVVNHYHVSLGKTGSAEKQPGLNTK